MYKPAWVDNFHVPWRLFALAAVILAIDLLTKYWATDFIEHLNYRVPVIPLFDITLRHNYGAAFSFLSDHDGWQRYFLAAVAGVMSIVLALWIMFLDAHKKLEGIALALILGGALGNLYDRIVHGYVVDFLLVYFKQYQWPAFNIADSAICIGAGLLLWDAFVGQKTKHE